MRAGIACHLSGCLFESRSCPAPHERPMLLFDKCFLRFPDCRPIQGRLAARTSTGLQQETLYVGLRMHLEGFRRFGPPYLQDG